VPVFSRGALNFLRWAFQLHRDSIDGAPRRRLTEAKISFGEVMPEDHPWFIPRWRAESVV